MNWSLLGGIFLVMAIFLATVAALIFYLRHWDARQRSRAGGQDVLEGIYFKRYIPPHLREKYDLQRSSVPAVGGARHRIATVSTVAIVLAAAAIFGGTVLTHYDSFLPTIDLDAEDLDGLVFDRHEWTARSDGRLPSLQSYLPSVRAKGTVLLSSGEDRSWRYKGVSLTNMAADHWLTFLQYHDLPYAQCDWEEIDSCGGADSHPLYVILPGQWNLTRVDRLLEAGESVILYGAPSQVMDGSVSPLNWRGMRFETHGTIGQDEGLALVGDQLLTLGFDAGLFIDVPVAIRGYRVTSADPQAIAMGSDRFVGGPLYTRLYASTVGAGRLVWMDFAPHFEDHSPQINVDHLNALMASVYRYLLKVPYASLASWPEGRRFAGLIEEDTEDHYSHAEKVSAMVSRNDFPITWFVLSNLALKYRGLTRKLSESGEIACHGDSHLPFSKDSPSTQIIRIARCQKVVEEITGKMPVGFRPPEERFNEMTLDAVYNNGMAYMLGEQGTDRIVPRLLENSEHASLVSIPRQVSDDFNLWVDGELDDEQSREIVGDEIAWVSALGGVYVLSFHSQFMGDEEHVGIVNFAAHELRRRKAYFATAFDIARWWRVRAVLLSGGTVDPDQLDRFGPVVISVTEEGTLSHDPLRDPGAGRYSFGSQ